MTDDDKEIKAAKRRRGIYLLPNLFTTAGLFAGFYSIVAAMKGNFESAAIAIFIAMFMDGIDGRLARLTNTQSAFGTEYDSLSDMIAFGLAPALIIYSWALSSLGKIGWLAAFIFTAGAALRLARFNTQVTTVDKAYFQGLASPPAAALIASMVWVCDDYGIEVNKFIAWLAMFVTVTIGVLMVSNIRYRSFKDIDIKNKVPFVVVFLVVLVYVFISIDPSSVLFMMALSYTVSGPLLTLIFLRKRRAERKSSATDAENNPPPSGKNTDDSQDSGL